MLRCCHALNAALILLLLALAVRVTPAQATCSLPDSEHKKLLAHGEKVNELLQGGAIQLVAIEDSESAGQLASILEAFDRSSPISAQQIRLHVTSSSDAVSLYFSSQDRAAFVIIDSEFMSAGKPKYNALLSMYKDSEIDAATKVMIDGLPAAPSQRPMVIQIRSKLGSQATAYLIEAAVVVGVGFLENSESLVRYAAELSGDVDDGVIETPMTKKRRDLLTCMFPSLAD